MRCEIAWNFIFMSNVGDPAKQRVVRRLRLARPHLCETISFNQTIEQAKNHTGIMTDTELIEFALATVALDDDFGKTFRETRGTVDPDLKLGF